MPAEHEPQQQHITRRRRAAVLVAGVLVAAACGNTDPAEPDGDAPETDAADGPEAPVDAPGVTDTEIRVGGVASVTNPLGAKFGDAFDGVDAYFQMVNEEGGVHGRQLTLASRRDDQVANNDAQVQALLTQDDVFAVLPVASILFTGADALVEAGVPTFGWAIDPAWEGSEEEPRENLFGQAGSFLCFDCARPTYPYVAQQVGATSVGLLAYNVPQSADCATGVERSFERYTEPGSAELVFSDTSLSYGTTDLSVQVAQMRDRGVDFVMTCMDLQGIVTLAREMNRQSVDTVQYVVNGYDHELVAEFGDLFQGSFVETNFVPFEVEDPPESLETYLEWMDRTGTEPTENSMNGWLNAALFVEGLRQAGPDFSREKVIDAINQMTDWNAGGLLHSVDWTVRHTEPARNVCHAFSRIEGDDFVPVLGEPGEPFICLDREADGIPDGIPSS
jgi:branched-chain amino acid transport system substrate-binding protein